MRSSRQDRVFNTLNFVVLTVVLLLILYPLYLIVISSVSDPFEVSLGRVTLFPQGFTLIGYQTVLRDRSIITGYRNTVGYTTAGTFVNISFTLLAAYALSRKDLIGRNVLTKLIVFTMLFQGGLIPTYMVVRRLGLLNSFGAMIWPNAVTVWNLIIARTFFRSTIPDELFESARVDGCTNRRFFWSIALPLSPALVAVMVLFYGVWHWNSFFPALIYLSDERRYPLQLVLRNILLLHEVSGMMETTDPAELQELQRRAESVKYAAIIVASLPVLALYPFLQRYFVKGVMIGAIKG